MVKQMVFVKWKQENEYVGAVTVVNYNPATLPESELAKGLTFSSLPEINTDKTGNGYTAKLKIDLTGYRLYYAYIPTYTEVFEELELFKQENSNLLLEMAQKDNIITSLQEDMASIILEIAGGNEQ